MVKGKQLEWLMLEPKAQALRKSAEMDPWTGVGLADSLPQPAR